MHPALHTGIAAATIVGMLSGPAGADMVVYHRAGGWDAFSGPGDNDKPVCGVGTTNPADSRSFSLRFPIGGENVVFQAKKPTWNIPAGTQISLVMQIGLDTPWNMEAVGNGQIVQWSLDRSAIQTFDVQFRRASSMTVTFPSGSEPPWTVGLKGSTAISNSFGRCITELTQRQASQAAAAAGTPPANQAATQPVGQAPTQPPAQPQPSSGPTQPFAPGGAPAAPR
jgi:hypothetical protein